MFKNLKRAFSLVFSSGGHDPELEVSTRFCPSGKPIVAAEINIPAARVDSISSERSISSIVENVRKRFRRHSQPNEHVPVASRRNPPLSANLAEVVNRNSDTNNHSISNLPPHLQYPPWIYQFGHGSSHLFSPASIPGLYYPPYPPLPNPNRVQPQPSSSTYPSLESIEGYDQCHLSRSLGSTNDIRQPSSFPGTVHDLVSHSHTAPQGDNTSGARSVDRQKELVQSENPSGDPDIFTTVDRTITDNHYWCDYGLARLVKTDDLVRDWDRSPQGHYHVHVPWSVAGQLDEFNIDWSTQTHTAKHGSFTAGKLSKTIDGGYRMFRHCLRFLECANHDCARITRAQSTQARITKQVGTPSLRLGCNQSGLGLSCGRGWQSAVTGEPDSLNTMEGGEVQAHTRINLAGSGTRRKSMSCTYMSII
ncbi:hypothetical protein PQX77_007986 [Marasmius sp. AFHP31]|nr:hypothetical protein PQX77_007986 [Marasmius sp. AFHP31]